MDNSNYLVQYVPAVPEKKKSSSTRVTEREEAERERKEKEEKRSGKRLSKWKKKECLVSKKANDKASRTNTNSSTADLLLTTSIPSVNVDDTDIKYESAVSV